MEALPPATEAAEGRTTPTADHVIHIDPRARMEILFAILLGLFLSALDQTIVGTAMPRILTDLSGIDLYTWVVTIYLLTSTVTGPIYGKLSDQFGRKRLLLFGVAVFLIGSFLSGLSQNMIELIFFRGLQGLGAGALFPISLAVIGDLFSPQERGKYQGLFGAVFGISALIGPALGGFLTDNISWHWVFFVNLPIGAVALFIIWRLLPAHTETGVTRKVDFLGAAVFTLALVPILVGLTNFQTTPLTDPWVGGLIIFGIVVGALFLWIESRAPEPIVPLGLFRNRTYSASMIAVFLASFGFFGAIVFLPLWYQVVQGASATSSGYQLLPLLAGLILTSIVSGQIVSRTGRYKWLTTGAMVVISIGLLLMSGLHANTPAPTLWFWQFIAGAGIGPSMAVFTIIIQNAVPWNQLGVATSNMTLFRQVGGTVGLALAGTIFGSAFRTQIPIQVGNNLTAAGVPQASIAQFAGQFSGAGSQFNQLTGVGDLGATISAQVPPQFQQFVPAIVTAIHEAMSLAIADTMWLGVGAALIAVVATLFIHEVPLRRSVHASSMAARKPAADSASGNLPATD
ncbi:MAG TPA: MDR family MFS transporter [Candidatus Limnocylindrales bacterium]